MPCWDAGSQVSSITSTVMRSSDTRNQLTKTRRASGMPRSLSMLMQQAAPDYFAGARNRKQICTYSVITSALISSLKAPDGQLRSNLVKLDTGTRRIDEAASSIRTSLEDLSACVGDVLLPRVNPLAADVADAMRSMKRAAGLLPIISPSFDMLGPHRTRAEPGFRWPMAHQRVP